MKECPEDHKRPIERHRTQEGATAGECRTGGNAAHRDAVGPGNLTDELMPSAGECVWTEPGAVREIGIVEPIRRSRAFRGFVRDYRLAVDVVTGAVRR